jgi:deoxyribodipyrimidine photo-lyase
MAASRHAAPDSSPAIVWFRDDLRLADNPALAAAATSHRPIICVYVQDEASAGLRPLGGAARWWLAGSLRALDLSLRERGGSLVFARGAADAVIPDLVSKSRARAP